MIKIFCSYAHKDQADLKDLTEIHLQPLVWDGRIELWDDRVISGGSLGGVRSTRTWMPPI
jgi:hypothetical protein